MPTYTTLDTIQEVMEDKKIVQWKVHDEDKNLLHHFNPAVTTQAKDSFNTLKKFVLPLKGTNYIIITCYAKAFTGKRGGDTAQTVFRYFYKLDDDAPVRKEKESNFSGGLGIADYLGLHKQINDLNALIVTQQKDREIADLKEQLKEGNGKGYFTSAAEAMGKGFFTEYMSKEGFEQVAGGEWVKKGTVGKTLTPSAEKKNDKAAETAKEKGMRGVKAMQVLTSLAGDAAIDGMEDIAAMAQKNPAKLLEILKEVKEANNDAG